MYRYENCSEEFIIDYDPTINSDIGQVCFNDSNETLKKIIGTL